MTKGLYPEGVGVYPDWVDTQPEPADIPPGKEIQPWHREAVRVILRTMYPKAPEHCFRDKIDIYAQLVANTEPTTSR